jgi:hypothetical protein
MYTGQDLQDEGSYRHWCPQSQPYAPADMLLQYLRVGCKLDCLVTVEAFYCAGQWRVDIYVFTLRRGENQVEMPVVANPVVLNTVKNYNLTVLQINSGGEEVKRLQIAR